MSNRAETLGGIGFVKHAKMWLTEVKYAKKGNIANDDDKYAVGNDGAKEPLAKGNKDNDMPIANDDDNEYAWWQAPCWGQRRWQTLTNNNHPKAYRHSGGGKGEEVWLDVGEYRGSAFYWGVNKLNKIWVKKINSLVLICL